MAAATAIAVVALGQTAIAQNLKHGEELLVKNCASCHAVGRNGVGAIIVYLKSIQQR